VADDVILGTGTGIVAAEVEAAARVLRDACCEYASSGTVEWRGDAVAVNRYSQREMSRQFAQLLDERNEASSAASIP